MKLSPLAFPLERRRRRIFLATLFVIGIESFSSGLLLDFLRDTFVAFDIHGPSLGASLYGIGGMVSKMPAPDFPRRYPFFSLVIAVPALLVMVASCRRGGNLRFPTRATSLQVLLFFQVWVISLTCLGFAVFLGPFRPIVQVLPYLGEDRSFAALSLIWVTIGLIAILLALVVKSFKARRE